MTSTNVWLTLSFVASFLPALVFLIAYSVRTRWEESPAGRVLFYMSSVMVVSYALSIMVLVFPGFFHDGVGITARVVIRFLLATMQWSLVWLFFRAQRFGAKEARRNRRKEQKENEES
jgi:uncharacterized membrane protein